eukprot:CAMPEP_0175050076 /NCGR_PEP_ID=MMETSP0052_2-20121109/7071_1 /TAXON_ID=51329 ORGANISM="Polytomella parva, Strain SAG 63-3" /NCGR_SAMPLE_ID=MMETSP0052_2 /ASSEMBLY_ACC=CAM_ASM_000194 /LENGTH=268 /DNA_ID=CAMNT_0016314265 /DNA_START=135 /DNA_END=941 /DNA_ORIENTATION=-
MKSLEEVVKAMLEQKGKTHANSQQLVLDNSCKSTNLKALESFTELRRLSLTGLGLTSLEGFPKAPKLTHLTLSDNKLGSGLEALKDLSELKHLKLPNNRISSFDQLEPLKGLNLKSLDLFECPIAETADFKVKILEMFKDLTRLNGEKLKKEGQEDEDGGDEDEEEEEEDEDEEEVEAPPSGTKVGGKSEYACLIADEDAEDDEEDYELEGDEGEDEDEDEEEGEDEEEEEEASSDEDNEDEDEDDEEEEKEEVKKEEQGAAKKRRVA